MVAVIRHATTLWEALNVHVMRGIYYMLMESNAQVLTLLENGIMNYIEADNDILCIVVLITMLLFFLGNNYNGTVRVSLTQETCMEMYMYVAHSLMSI